MGNRQQETIDALDMMVAGVTQRKADKSKVLTPVGTETARLPKTKEAFPNDKPQEIVEQAIVVIEEQAGYLMGAAAALRTLIDQPARDPDPVDETKEEEREADRRIVSGEADTTESFKEEFARKSKSAQDATFGQTSVEDEPVVKSGWTCPKHGDKNLVPTTSGKGRKYTYCAVTGCKEFEK